MSNWIRKEIEYEVWCGDECMAVTSGDRAEDEAWGYAQLYEEEGEVRVYLVEKNYERIG